MKKSITILYTICTISNLFAQLPLDNKQISVLKSTIDSLVDEFQENDSFSKNDIMDGWEIIHGAITKYNNAHVQIDSTWYYYGSKIVSKDGVEPIVGDVGKFYVLFDVVYYFFPEVLKISFQKPHEGDDFFLRWDYSFNDIISEYRIIQNNIRDNTIPITLNIERGYVNKDPFWCSLEYDEDGLSCSYKYPYQKLAMNIFQSFHIQGLNPHGKIVVETRTPYTLVNLNSRNYHGVITARDTTITLSWEEFDLRGSAFPDNRKSGANVGDVKYRVDQQEFIKDIKQYRDIIVVDTDTSVDSVSFIFKYFPIRSNYLLKTNSSTYLYMVKTLFNYNYAVDEKIILRLLMLTNTNDFNKKENKTRQEPPATLSQTLLNRNSTFVLFVPKSLYTDIMR